MRILYSCALDLIKFPAPGQHVTNIVRELAARGHTMTLVHQGGKLRGIEPSQQYSLRLKRFRLLGRLITDVRYTISLIKILRKDKYDCVYHRLEKWTVLPLLVFKVYRIPVVLEINADVRVELASVNAGRISRKTYPLSENWQVRLARKIVVVSEGIGASLEKNIPSCKDKIVVIENGADTGIFFPRSKSEACKTLNLDPNRQYIVFSGSFQPWQGLHTLINAANQVVSSIPNVKFILAGDGNIRQSIEQEIKEKNLESSFLLTGWLEPLHLSLYLAASDVCVAPYSELAASDPTTKHTNFKSTLMKCSPLKIYTYMAMGKPVVASGFLDGGERISEWKAGLAFTPGNDLELSEALITLLKDKKLANQLASKAVERVKLHHTWAAVAQRIDEHCLVNINKIKL